ncbi:DUF3592 domain-containing protein [Streptomyces sp. NPDC046261]|uniref:DUF3592 domain-containing protein n=1 Tax=Streptomyces sp. NPDC046261 TaxID=3157200 RepID=UPI0033C93C2B
MTVAIILVATLMLFIPVWILIALELIPRRRRARLKRVGIRASGRCVSISWIDNAAVAAIEYATPDGRKFTHHTNPSYVSPFTKGGAAVIVYDPRNPRNARVADWLDGEPGSRFATWVLVALEGIFLIPQAWWIYILLSGGFDL